MSNAFNDPDEPQLEPVGHLEDGFIIWDDGSPPTPWPQNLNTQPADAVCPSDHDEEE